MRNLKSHEVMLKIRSLKLSTFVEDLVKEDCPAYEGGLDLEGDAIDYELCIHKDFLFMLRQRGKAQMA